jgi:hypothetical protein
MKGKSGSVVAGPLIFLFFLFVVEGPFFKGVFGKNGVLVW